LYKTYSIVVFEQGNFSYWETWQSTNFARQQGSIKNIWESNLSTLMLLNRYTVIVAVIKPKMFHRKFAIYTRQLENKTCHFKTCNRDLLVCNRLYGENDLKNTSRKLSLILHIVFCFSFFTITWGIFDILKSFLIGAAFAYYGNVREYIKIFIPTVLGLKTFKVNLLSHFMNSIFIHWNNQWLSITQNNQYGYI
jgi:hypothetical protein